MSSDLIICFLCKDNDIKQQQQQQQQQRQHRQQQQQHRQQQQSRAVESVVIIAIKSGEPNTIGSMTLMSILSMVFMSLKSLCKGSAYK